MILLAPAFLWGAIAAAAGMVALHFIVTRQPRASILPTARFVPDSRATAIVRDARPADLLLMLLRVLVILAAGAALAKPVIKPARKASARLFLVDASRATANSHEASDSVSSLYRDGDAVIVFDSATRSLGRGQRPLDSLVTLRRSDATGNLSAALVAALREGTVLQDKVDSIELVVVSPLLVEEHDAATDSIRKLWPGRVRLVRVAARADSSGQAERGEITLRSDPDDPLRVAVSLVPKSEIHRSVRILRSATLSAEDSAWMTSDSHVLVRWPSSDRPPLAVRLTAGQSGGVVAREAHLVSAFNRSWRFPVDSLRGMTATVRWVDGEAAVVEKRIGDGCVRSVAIRVPTVGDLVIRPEFVRLVETIAAPCGDGGPAVSSSPSSVASLAGSGRLAPNGAFAPREDLSSPVAPWLFGLALAAALAELVVRGYGRKKLAR